MYNGVLVTLRTSVRLSVHARVGGLLITPCLLRVVNESLIPAWIRAHAKSRIPNDLLVPAHAVPANTNELTTTAIGRSKRPRYGVAAMGGTFDHLHAGHKILLSMAAWIAEEKLIVGVTGASAKSFAYAYGAAGPRFLIRGRGEFVITADQEGADDPLLVKKAYREVLESIDIRIAGVREFLELFKRAVKYDIVPITDVYGPTAADSNIQVLIVSRETVSGANASEFIQISCETYGCTQSNRVHLDAICFSDLVYGAVRS